MVFPEADLLPISALQHLVFCERQCALIHLEGAWADNRLTAEGRALHERVHEPGTESRSDRRIVRSLRLRSLRHGLSGIGDVVEFHRTDELTENAIPIPGLERFWIPFPVEYKRGHPKPTDCDLVQLCTQALCLEEMLSVRVDAGAIFYGQPRRRLEVSFDSALRTTTEGTVARLHKLIGSGVTPPAVYGKKCENCSLMPLCLPKAKASASAYLRAAIAELGRAEP